MERQPGCEDPSRRSRAGWKVLADGYQALNLRDKADQAARRHAQLSGIDTSEMAESAISFEEVIADLEAYGGQAPEEPVPTLFTLLQDVQTKGWGESGRAGMPREPVAASLAGPAGGVAGRGGRRR